MASSTVWNAISAIVALFAICIGLLLSPIPTRLGFWRWITTIRPPWVGLCPACHYGVPWGYTLEELYTVDCPKLVGQRALVTGANAGIGFEISLALARCGVHVTMACRNPSKCDKAVDRIKTDDRFQKETTVLTPMTMDTSSLKSVRQFSLEFLERNKGDDDDETAALVLPLDMLFLNAGMGMGGTPGSKVVPLSEDGIEKVYATNVVGHHLLYKLLEPAVLASNMARVVLTSSAASYETVPHILSTNLEQLNSDSIDPMSGLHYGHSKLAQIYWAQELTRLRRSENNLYVNAAHPGFVDTEIFGKMALPGPMRMLIEFLRSRAMWSAELGALTELYLGVATDQLQQKQIRGRYYHPQAQDMSDRHPLIKNETLQIEHWKFLDELVQDFVI